jgi:hypothetical protein
VQRLVDRRLVAKVPARDDRRRAHLAITDAGAALLRRSPEPVQDRLITAIGLLPEPQRRALADALDDIAQAIGASGRASMFFEEPPLERRRPSRRFARLRPAGAKR